jgi:hypothetical protein
MSYFYFSFLTALEILKRKTSIYVLIQKETKGNNSSLQRS